MSQWEAAALYSIGVKTIDGQETTLDQFRGKVLLIVNTASECGFTAQYQGLQEIYDHFKDRGFVVLGFPCNQFGGQEPGDAVTIKSFCEARFGVTFPLFEKVEVNGEGAHPLFVHLKRSAPGLLGTEGIKWNFTKFLVDRNGKVSGRFAPTTAPGELLEEIEALLGA